MSAVLGAVTGTGLEALRGQMTPLLHFWASFCAEQLSPGCYSISNDFKTLTLRAKVRADTSQDTSHAFSRSASPDDQFICFYIFSPCYGPTGLGYCCRLPGLPDLTLAPAEAMPFFLENKSHCGMLPCFPYITNPSFRSVIPYLAQ